MCLLAIILIGYLYVTGNTSILIETGMVGFRTITVGLSEQPSTSLRASGSAPSAAR
jgi:hypothetical protein